VRVDRQDRRLGQLDLAAVGFAVLHGLRAQATTGTGLVVDDELASIASAQLLGRQARVGIGRNPGGKSDDDVERLVDHGLRHRQRSVGGEHQGQGGCGSVGMGHRRRR
jgi:hypothetical protein